MRSLGNHRLISLSIKCALRTRACFLTLSFLTAVAPEINTLLKFLHHFSLCSYFVHNLHFTALNLPSFPTSYSNHSPFLSILSFHLFTAASIFNTWCVAKTWRFARPSPRPVYSSHVCALGRFAWFFEKGGKFYREECALKNIWWK